MIRRGRWKEERNGEKTRVRKKKSERDYEKERERGIESGKERDEKGDW